MLYLPELRKLNNPAEKTVLEPPVLRDDDFIIVVYTPGKPKSYYGTAGYYSHDPKTVVGWNSGQFDDAVIRATELDLGLAHDVKTAVAQRSSLYAKSR